MRCDVPLSSYSLRYAPCDGPDALQHAYGHHICIASADAYSKLFVRLFRAQVSRHVVMICMLCRVVMQARQGPAGPFSMDGPALGLALAKLEPEAYRQLPCSAQGKLRLKAVCENSPCFVRIPVHQTQVGRVREAYWMARPDADVRTG